jgi:hypothetical protein
MYVTYPQFKKEWLVYRKTNHAHAHVRDELVNRTIKEKSLAPSVKALVGDVEDLQ